MKNLKLPLLINSRAPTKQTWSNPFFISLDLFLFSKPGFLRQDPVSNIWWNLWPDSARAGEKGQVVPAALRQGPRASGRQDSPRGGCYPCQWNQKVSAIVVSTITYLLILGLTKYWLSNSGLSYWNDWTF